MTSPESIYKAALERIVAEGKREGGAAGGFYEGPAGIADEALKAVERARKREQREKQTAEVCR